MTTHTATATVEEHPHARKASLHDKVTDALGQLEEIESLAILICSYIDGQQPILYAATNLLARAALCCMRSLSSIVDREDQKKRLRHARSKR